MDKIRTCFFTGHRRLSAERREEIKSSLLNNIEKLIVEHDVKNFISGGALGFDTLAAEAVREIRYKYPHIRLLLYLPCYGQEKKWSAKQQYRYNLMKAGADEILYVTEGEYTDKCMLLRNLRMIRDSHYCIAFCVMERSGTGLTIKNATEVGVKVINIADEIYGN